MNPATAPNRPGPDEYPAGFHDYIERVPEHDILAVLAAQTGEIAGLGARIPAERESYSYAPGKWSLRELVGHLVDGERCFSFRALAFSRRDAAALPGFDEDSYVANSRFAAIPLADLIDELVHLRHANVRMFSGLGAEQWDLAGIANDKRVTVRALAWCMAGHLRHHLEVVANRYGVRT